MVNADTTTKKQSEQCERMRHFVIKSVLFFAFNPALPTGLVSSDTFSVGKNTCLPETGVKRFQTVKRVKQSMLFTPACQS